MEIGPFLRPSPEDVHDVVDNGSGVAFPRNGNVSYTIEERPLVRGWVVTPDVVEPLKPIRPTKSGSRKQADAKCKKKDTYRYILSAQVTMVWLVLAGGILPCSTAVSSLLSMSISQRLFGICNWLRSKAARSFIKKPSTWPPKT